MPTIKVIYGDTIQLYLSQWLSTAGNFSFDFAWQTNRMQVRCKCGAILRTDQPTVSAADPTGIAIPWVLQDWVAIHGHNGTHGATEKMAAEYAALSAIGALTELEKVKAGIAELLVTKGRRPSEAPKRKPVKILSGRRFR
jgi:hypothetical protein